jgi:hypothetical protein
LTNPVFLIIAAVVALGAAFVWAWTHVAEFRDNVIAALLPLRTAWFEFLAAISQLGAALGPVGAWFGGLLASAQGPLNAIIYIFGFVFGFIFTLVIGIMGRIGAGVLQALTGVVNIVRGFVDLMVGLFTGDLDKARSGALRIWEGIKQILSSPLRLFAPNWEALRGALNAAWAWVTDFASRMWEAGANLIQGLVNGITSKVGDVVNAVKRVTGLANTTVTTETDQRSPSRLWHHYGAMLPAGLALGVLGGAPAVAKAVQELPLSPAPLVRQVEARVSFTPLPPSLSLPSITPIPAAPELVSEAIGAGETPQPSVAPLVSARSAQAPRQSRRIPNITFSITIVQQPGQSAEQMAEQVAELAANKVLLAIEQAALEEGYGG